jgi:long-subunit fatty acid transport protein
MPRRLYASGAVLLKVLAAVFIISLMLPARIANAVEFSSSLNPVGSGARATGMGGAFIAIVDDATAASWNPAGLINLEKPEFSIVYSYFNRSHSYNSDVHPEVVGSTQTMDANDINYASIAYPFVLFGRNMIVTFNYQRLYDMTKDNSLNFNADLGGGNFNNTRVHYTQDGYLGAFSPAIAIQVLPELYFGATVNIWDDFAGTSHWESRLDTTGSGQLGGNPFDETSVRTTKNTFSGLNAHLGLLYNLKSKFAFGFVYKTPFEADLTSESELVRNQTFPLTDFLNSSSASSLTTNSKMSIPASYGIGIAYRHSDSLTFALDLYRTEWSDFVLTDSVGNQTNPLTTLPLSEGRCKDTTQVRLGTEYLLIGEKTIVPLRAGLFYDPEPSGTTLDDYYGFSLGTGVAYGKYIFDVSYQYRFGNGVGGDLPNAGITSDVTQHTVMTSLIYHFK